MWYMYERPLHVKYKFRNFNCFCFTTFLIWFNKMPCFLVSVLFIVDNKSVTGLNSYKKAGKLL